MSEAVLSDHQQQTIRCSTSAHTGTYVHVHNIHPGGSGNFRLNCYRELPLRVILGYSAPKIQEMFESIFSSYRQMMVQGYRQSKTSISALGILLAAEKPIFIMTRYQVPTLVPGT